MEIEHKTRFSVVESVWRNFFSGGLSVTLQIFILGIFLLILFFLGLGEVQLIVWLITISALIVILAALEQARKYTLSYKKIEDNFLEFSAENIILYEGSQTQHFPTKGIKHLQIHYHEDSLKNGSTRILWEYQTQKYEIEIAIETLNDTELLLDCIGILYRNEVRFQEFNKNGVPTYLLKLKTFEESTKNLEALIAKIGEKSEG